MTILKTGILPAGAAPVLSAKGAALDVANLVKRYGDVEAVRNLSLKVEAGEFVTLLGPSGSGKTTTLGMVAGFEQPSSGTITLGGRDITNKVTHKRNLGMIFQGYALFPHMSVFDNVAFPLKLRKVSKNELRRRVTDALDIVALSPYADRRPGALSGGQQQRVALARAIVHRPPLLLMDEPLSALDKSLRAQMQLELRKIHEEIGSTVLFVTHDQEEALSLSDRIVVMNDGEIAQVGTPTEIYEQPTSEFVARFIGTAQFVAGTLSGAQEHGTDTELQSVGGLRLVGRATSTSADGTPAKAVLRPEDACLTPPAEASNAVPVQVLAQVYLGDRIRCQVVFPDGSEGMAWLDHHESTRVHVGDTVTLYWPCARTVFVT